MILPTTVGNCLQCWDVTGGWGVLPDSAQAQTEIRWTMLFSGPELCVRGNTCHQELCL